MVDRVIAEPRDLRTFASRLNSASQEMDRVSTGLRRAMSDVERTWRDPQKDAAWQAIDEYMRAAKKAQSQLMNVQGYCSRLATHLEGVPGYGG